MGGTVFTLLVSAGRLPKAGEGTEMERQEEIK